MAERRGGLHNPRMEAAKYHFGLRFDKPCRGALSSFEPPATSADSSKPLVAAQSEKSSHLLPSSFAERQAGRKTWQLPTKDVCASLHHRTTRKESHHFRIPRYLPARAHTLDCLRHPKCSRFYPKLGQCTMSRGDLGDLKFLSRSRSGTARLGRMWDETRPVSCLSACVSWYLGPARSLDSLSLCRLLCRYPLLHAGLTKMEEQVVGCSCQEMVLGFSCFASCTPTCGVCCSIIWSAAHSCQPQTCSRLKRRWIRSWRSLLLGHESRDFASSLVP